MRLGLVISILFSLSVHAQDGLAERNRLVKVLRCKDVSCVQNLVSSNANKVERLVAACRTFELRPNAKRASDVFDALPVTHEESSSLYRITEPVAGISDENLELLNRFYYRGLTRGLVAASKLVPERLPRLLEYGLVDSDVHSEFPKVAEKVCRARGKEFRQAFSRLTGSESRQLEQEMIDPRTCRPIRGEE
jgi:hypothetical protein